MASGSAPRDLGQSDLEKRIRTLAGLPLGWLEEGDSETLAGAADIVARLARKNAELNARIADLDLSDLPGETQTS